MKRNLTGVLLFITCFLMDGQRQAIAQSTQSETSFSRDKTPVSYTPLQLHFIEDRSVRNFFNLAIPYNKLDLTTNALDSVTYPRVDIESTLAFSEKEHTLTISNPGKRIAESYLKIGSLLRYGAVDLDVSAQIQKTYTASVILSFQKDAQNRILVEQRGKGADSAIYKVQIFKGGANVFSQTLSPASIGVPYTMRVHITGKYLNFFRLKNGRSAYFATVDISKYFDLRSDSVLARFSVLIGAKLGPGESVGITRTAQYLSSGTGQADPRVLHYEDGQPIYENGSIWLAMTIRGYDPIPSSHQGIFRYDIASKKYTLVGDMSFDKGDGVKRPWHASDVFFDRKDHTWKVLTVSHGDDHKIYAGVCVKDPRTGISEVSVKLLNYPALNDEDPSIVYDPIVMKWRVVMCRPGGGGFKTVLFESANWNGPYTQIAQYTPISTTGNLIQKVGGKYYVFLGRGSANYEVLSYPDLIKIGTLNADPLLKAHNIWPVIIPITGATGTNYYMLTFDRAGVTGAYSYGNLYWYNAMEFAKGFFEY